MREHIEEMRTAPQTWGYSSWSEWIDKNTVSREVQQKIHECARRGRAQIEILLREGVPKDKIPEVLYQMTKLKMRWER